MTSPRQARSGLSVFDNDDIHSYKSKSLFDSDRGRASGRSAAANHSELEPIRGHASEPHAYSQYMSQHKRAMRMRMERSHTTGWLARALSLLTVLTAIGPASSSQAAPVRLELFGSLIDVQHSFVPPNTDLGLRDGDPFRIVLELDPVADAGEPFSLSRAEARIKEAVFPATALANVSFRMSPSPDPGGLDFVLSGHPGWIGPLGGQEVRIETIAAFPLLLSFTTQGVAGATPGAFPLDLAFSDVTSQLSGALVATETNPAPGGGSTASFRFELEGLGVEVVPEPGVATLLGLGLAGLGMTNGRRERAMRGDR